MRSVRDVSRWTLAVAVGTLATVAASLALVVYPGTAQSQAQPGSGPAQPSPQGAAAGVHEDLEPDGVDNALPSAQSPASARAEGPIQNAVDKLASTIKDYGGSVGVHVIDITTGKTLGAHAPKAALNPASNMKLVTAAVALTKLTGSFTFRTALYGKQDATSVGNIVLRGYGDPSLNTKDLWELVNGLQRLGVRGVSGDILVDQSYFDNKYVPPGFEQQPNEWAYFRAPVSAVALAANTVTMHVTGSTAGQRAWVSFDPPGFVDVNGSVGTAEKGASQNVTMTLVPKAGRLQATIGGNIPEDSPRLRVTKRVDDPTLFAGYALASILSDQGIKFSGSVKAGGQQMQRMLVQHRSQRLGTLLEYLGKDSDNFYAEMIFKSLDSGEQRRGLTTDSGVKVTEEYLKKIGAWSDGMVIRNGSGLFDTNRLTAQSLTTILRTMYTDPENHSEYLNHLAIAGKDGTLRSRLRDKRTRGRVRAKTGTLASVISLSGYVVDGVRQPVAFSIIVNNVAGKVSGARDAIDTCVRSIARNAPKTSR